MTSLRPSTARLRFSIHHSRFGIHDYHDRVTPYEERIAQHLRELGISPSYGADRGLPLCVEPPEVVLIGLDIFGRARQLEPHAAQQWSAMREAAGAAGIELLLVSAFRDVEYQRSIFDRKLGQGVPLDDILRVNAAPGYSEHHTGRAVDIASRGCPPLTEGFETTTVFEWLTRNASRFGFEMSYPRGNRYGMAYEPWHWAIHESSNFAPSRIA
jgi:zinc D-Ala-D-Ala carboxypeptidase